ncbi:hypothetical protein BurJ1DRAFT_3743 [Burkholderiales bacterium JOSHI_001]|nr:hypothetical protein BurJ1DRAFT_3743 [Burkholderiales bacterium JOSHI_001]
MLLLVLTLKLLCEVALLALLGQAVLQLLLRLMGSTAPDANPVARVLAVVVQPPQAAARRLLPRWVPPRHLPAATGALLLGLWLLATAWKISLCLPLGAAACR